jgi:hypothetical protein
VLVQIVRGAVLHRIARAHVEKHAIATVLEERANERLLVIL